jgi:hypothetical protein
MLDFENSLLLDDSSLISRYSRQCLHFFATASIVSPHIGHAFVSELMYKKSFQYKVAKYLTLDIQDIGICGIAISYFPLFYF